MTIYRSGCWSLASLTLVTLFLVAKPASATVRMPTHVACVGDSITEGFAASNPATKSYPAQLQGLFGSQVMVKNFGHTGTTMLSDGFGDSPYEDTNEYQAATTFVKGAGANAVVDVIIMLGTNDSKPQNWTPAGKPKNDQQFLKDYRAMVEHFNALTPKPLVFLALPTSTGNNPCCSINGTVIHDEEVPLIKQLATEQSLPIIDLNTPTAGHPEYFGDGVHPTDAGYLIVAMLIHAGLLQDFTPGAVDAGADSSGSAADSSADGGGSASDGSAADAASDGTGGSAGTGGSSSAAGSGGSGAGAGALGIGGGGQSGSATASSGQAGSGGGAPAAQGRGSASSGCSLSGSREPGSLASLVSLSVLLSLIRLRRSRFVKQGEQCRHGSGSAERGAAPCRCSDCCAMSPGSDAAGRIRRTRRGPSGRWLLTPSAARRLIVYYFPDGIPEQPDGEPSQWHMAGTGKDFTLSRNLQPLAPFRGTCVFFNNLTMGPIGEGAHPEGAMKLLTGTPDPNQKETIQGPSLDQYLGQTIGQDTTFPSIYLGAQATADSTTSDAFISYPNATHHRTEHGRALAEQAGVRGERVAHSQPRRSLDVDRHRDGRPCHEHRTAGLWSRVDRGGAFRPRGLSFRASRWRASKCRCRRCRR